MEKFYIEQSDKTPRILLDAENMHFEFSGTSRPENVRDVYYPVIEYLGNFFKGDFLKKKPEVKVRFKFSFEYFNSSSAKFIYDILALIKKAKDDNKNVEIDWHFLETDEDMKEVGEEFSDIIDMPFNYIMIKE